MGRTDTRGASARRPYWNVASNSTVPKLVNTSFHGIDLPRTVRASRSTQTHDAAQTAASTNQTEPSTRSRSMEPVDTMETTVPAIRVTDARTRSQAGSSEPHLL